MQLPEHLPWEIILVDNNSSDATRETCAQFEKILPLRYVFESRQGLSCARNRGVREARGQLFLFTDDDVTVDPRWVASYLEGAESQPDADFFGGKIIPVWEKKPPAWLAMHSENRLVGISMCFSKGETPRFLERAETPFFGANMGFRRAVFQDGFFFREDLGRKGCNCISYEEAEFMQRLLARGCRGFYLPAAIIYHHNDPARMTEGYLRSFFYGAGVSEARAGQIKTGEHDWLGAPRWLWRRCLTNAFFYVISRFTRNAEVWVPHECKMASSWGSICELRVQAGNRRS
jgi:glycosyltransferase involved in cell wall biosynthesis